MQRSILAKKVTFFKKKGAHEFHHPLFNPFLSVLHQDKVLHNFCKRGQYSIVKCKKGPDKGCVVKELTLTLAMKTLTGLITKADKNDG